MLFRNVLRTLKQRWVQLILLGVMILLSSFIYTVMDYAISGTLEPTESYFDEANQEDFAISMRDVLAPDDYAFIGANCPTIASLPQADWPFTMSVIYTIDETCYQDFLDHRLQAIEDVYDGIDLEVRKSKDIYFNHNNESYRFRVLDDMDRINQSYMVEGVKPADDDDIAVSEVFGRKNDLAIGDTITVNGTDYTVSGYVLFPDYSLTLLGTELIIDNQTQSLVLMTDNAFDELDERIDAEIAGVYTGDYTDDTFEEEVIRNFRNHDELGFITQIVLTINNMRSGAIYAELEGGKGMSIFLSLLIASIALMIVSIMVSRVLHAQRGPIGILKSMGYTNGQIARPYLFFIALMSLPTLIAGYFIGLLGARPMMMAYLEFYVLPYQDIAQSWSVVLISIIVPFVFIVALSYVIILRLLRQKPVTLLNPEATSSTSRLATWISRRLKGFKITRKLQQLLLFRSIVKFIVFLTAMFYAAFLILFSFSMNGVFDRMLFNYYEDTHHNYIGYCDYQGDCPVPTGSDYDAEEVIELPSVVVNDEDASLLGIETGSEIHPLYDKRHNVITNDLADGVIVSKALAINRGYDVGDELEILIGDDTVTYEITGISEDYTGNRVYIDRVTLSQVLTDTADYYNTVFSATELSEDDYRVVIDVDNIIEQADNMNVLMDVTVGLLVVVSIVIGAIIIYILTVMTIEDNFYNISLFKVIGYDNKEIDQIVLGGYLLYGIAIFLVTIPVAIVSFELLEMLFSRMYDLSMPLAFYWWHAVIGIVIYIVLFYIGAYSAKKKLEHIALQEAMKMYQV